MSKQAIEGAKRGVLFYVDPSDVDLQGIDYESGPEDPCYNPRNKEPVNAGLVQSIMRLGVLEPIGVVKRGERLSVLYGNQRVRAARAATEEHKAAGVKTQILIPCLTPMRGLDDAQLGEAAIAENEHRRESSALTKSELASVQLRRKGGDFKEAAQAFGLSVPKFRALISLKESAPEVKTALRAGRLSASAAIEVASLPKDKQAERLETIISAGGTAEIARNSVRHAKGRVEKSRPTPTLLRELAARRKDFPELSDSFWKAIAWTLGDLDARFVPGLLNALKALSVAA